MLSSSIGGFLASTEGGHGLSMVGLGLYILFVLGILFFLMVRAKKGLGDRVFTNPITQLFEQLYLFIENMCVGTIGAHGRKYIPMIMGLWCVIFLGNVVALFFPTSPTADLSFNIAMALICVGYVQWEGMKTNGVFGHFKHFAGPKLPVLLAIFITPMIFAIEVISELMKNVSLSLRLYGNIHGGHEAVTAMNQLGGNWVPVGMFLLPIKLLTVIVQALIFTLLTCVYLSLVTHHEEEHHEAAAH